MLKKILSLAKHLKVPCGPYEHVHAKQVAVTSESMRHSLEAFGLKVKCVQKHSKQTIEGQLYADCPIGLCAHMSHIGQVWASASETPEEALEALAMGSERHIFQWHKKLVVIELAAVLKQMDQADFIDAVIKLNKKKITEETREHYLSRGLEACPYVLTDFDISFQFET